MNSEFGALIRRERRKSWLSGRQFVSQTGLPMSYTRYSVIESGKRPYASLSSAIQILEHLKIDESLGLHAWVRDLMPDDHRKHYFFDTDERRLRPRSTTITVNSEQKPFFEKSPIYKEVSAYISMYSYRGVCINELTQIFSMRKNDLQLILNQLETLELVQLKEKKYYVPAECWIETPNIPQFRKAVTQVFRSAINSHFSHQFIQGKSIEHSTLRLINDQQLQELSQRVDVLARWISLLPDDTDEGKPYRFFIGGNYATFGDSKKHFVPYQKHNY